MPTALHGPPITADQDIFIAFQKLVTDIQMRESRVSNPIGFITSKLISLLSQTDAGKNYRDVDAWLDVMTFNHDTF